MVGYWNGLLDLPHSTQLRRVGLVRKWVALHYLEPSMDGSKNCCIFAWPPARGPWRDKMYPVPLKLMALQLGYDLRMFEIPTNGKMWNRVSLLLQECHPMSDYELRGPDDG